MEPGEWVALIGGILTIIDIVVGALLWSIRAAIRDEVVQATQPIQPGYRNGGQSLADVAELVKQIAKKMDLEEW
mgnify:CR=1 FL=1